MGKSGNAGGCLCAVLRPHEGDPIVDPSHFKARGDKFAQLAASGHLAGVISLIVLRDGSLYLTGYGKFGGIEDFAGKVISEITKLEKDPH